MSKLTNVAKQLGKSFITSNAEKELTTTAHEAAFDSEKWSKHFLDIYKSTSTSTSTTNTHTQDAWAYNYESLTTNHEVTGISYAFVLLPKIKNVLAVRSSLSNTLQADFYRVVYHDKTQQRVDSSTVINSMVALHSTYEAMGEKAARELLPFFAAKNPEFWLQYTAIDDVYSSES